MSSRMSLDTVDKKLLNLLQAGFPLEREPFEVIGGKLGLEVGGVISRVQRLKSEGIIREIGGVFESSRLGYHSTLVAMHIPERRLDEAADIISEHKGVSHNYVRNHYYNLWFTLTLPQNTTLPDEISALARRAGAKSTINLPAIRVFKIHVYFDMLGDGESSSALSQNGGSSRLAEEESGLSVQDKEIVKELQKELPIQEKPFDEMAVRLNLGTDELLIKARELQSRGIMRRYSAAIRHKQAGVIANAMSCWIVPSDLVEDAGRKMAATKAVSHCYERQTAADWPYNLFAMIHGRSEEDCQAVAEQISHDTGIIDYILLYSSREYKKKRIQYFTEEVL